MQGGELSDYLNEVADKLAQLGGTFTYDPILEVDWENHAAYLRTSTRFNDRSRLELTIICLGPRDFPDWLAYKVQFMDGANRCIFRYDNAGHHPGTSHFPHHKHVGPDETPVDHPRPSLAHILDEVRAYVYREESAE
jgi:hypothetical protein